MRLLNGLLVVIFLMLFAACTPASPDSEEVAQDASTGEPADIAPLDEATPTDEPTATATATSTPQPTPTPRPGFPAIELLAAPGLGCSFDPATDDALLFNALYYNMSSDYEVRERIFDEQGDMLFETRTTGTEMSGPDVYAVTPDAYEVPEESALTLELVVFPIGIEDATFTARSLLIYQCTTGQTIENSFERAGR